MTSVPRFREVPCHLLRIGYRDCSSRRGVCKEEGGGRKPESHDLAPSPRILDYTVPDQNDDGVHEGNSIFIYTSSSMARRPSIDDRSVSQSVRGQSETRSKRRCGPLLLPIRKSLQSWSGSRCSEEPEEVARWLNWYVHWTRQSHNEIISCHHQPLVSAHEQQG